MSRANRKTASAPRLNRTEMKVFLQRQGMSYPEFCARHGINYESFANWMRGNELMPLLNERIYTILQGYNYNLQLLTSFDPHLRLGIEAACA